MSTTDQGGEFKQPLQHTKSQSVRKMKEVFGSLHQAKHPHSSLPPTYGKEKTASIIPDIGEGEKSVENVHGEWKRLLENEAREKNWKRWGPYLSERQWGTVREDYSENGDSWEYCTRDMAVMKAYRWGEDGILGICDRQCRLCFSLSMWNQKDPELKERLFGLSGTEGNHGEDVKEYYFYLNSTPCHTWMKGLYKYPQCEFPYKQLIDENKRRTREDREFELLDTGIFDEKKYWDVFAEYAKPEPNDVLVRITVANRGPEEAEIHLLPTLWHRNTWSFNSPIEEGDTNVKVIEVDEQNIGRLKTDTSFGSYIFDCDVFSWNSEKGAGSGDAKYLVHEPKWLFTENDSNNEKLYNSQSRTPYVKDAFQRYLTQQEAKAVNPENKGSKAAVHLHLRVPAGEEIVLKLRLSDVHERSGEAFGNAFEETFTSLIREHDEYYNAIIPTELTEEERSVCIQGFAGLLWSKQFYHYVIRDWLDGDPGQPKPPQQRKKGRNSDWGHLFNRDVISVPDKWEFPWYAVWDLAFHMVSMAHVDIHFAKEQLLVFLREWYMHPNGCLPAYEYGFSDVNPPVHAWACYRVYKLSGDTSFLQSVFQKLIVNFTWWVNRKDPEGYNLFSGGFLGLDNIGVFDRSQPLPRGGHLQQADATSWMAFYCLYMLKIALELALKVDPVYEDMASKFFEHFVLISDAMNALTEGKEGLWDAQDTFFYDALKQDNERIPLKVRSLVGLTPLFATGVISGEHMVKLKGFKKRTEWFLEHRKDLANQISLLHRKDENESMYAFNFREAMLNYLYDEGEFLSNFGIRSVSRFHEQNPYVFKCGDNEQRVDYLPGESNSSIFGGNSNWRGPVWFPMNYLLIEALERLDHFYGESLEHEFPNGHETKSTAYDASIEICRRLTSLMLPDRNGKRPCHGEHDIWHTDPHWKNYVLFYEHFHPETGRGLGASHQTGWTSLVVNCLFKVGLYRAARSNLCPQNFLNKNYSEFHVEAWKKADEERDKHLQRNGFGSIAEMMEHFFHNQPWRYRDLLIDHVLRTEKV